MQNTDASVAADGLCVIERPAGDAVLGDASGRRLLPKQPTVAARVGLTRAEDAGRVGLLAVPVVSGDRFDGDHTDVRAVDARAAARRAGMRAVRAAGRAVTRQARRSWSWCRSCRRAARGRRCPCPGLLGVPVAEHFGQGCARLPVRYDVGVQRDVRRRGARWRGRAVPLAGDGQVLSTQVVMPGMVGFGIGSGVPKLQPVLVQSGVPVLTAGAVDVGPMVQAEPAAAEREPALRAVGRGPFRDDARRRRRC